MSFNLNSILVSTLISKGNKEITNYFYKVIEINGDMMTVVAITSKMDRATFIGRDGKVKFHMSGLETPSERYPLELEQHRVFTLQYKGKNTTINGSRVKVWDEQPLPFKFKTKTFCF